LGHELNPLVLIGIAVILVIGKVGGEIFERLRQPAVLGELVAGMLVGSLAYFGLSAIDSLKTDTVIAALAQIGVIILLFEVGLETNLQEMKEVGWSSLFVASASGVSHATSYQTNPTSLTSSSAPPFAQLVLELQRECCAILGK